MNSARQEDYVVEDGEILILPLEKAIALARAKVVRRRFYFWDENQWESLTDGKIYFNLFPTARVFHLKL